MVNKEFAAVLVEYAGHIQRYAELADVKEDTAVSKRARNNGWRLLCKLIEFAEHTKESDMYFLMLDIAIRDDKSAKEQHRLHSIAKQEDRGFMRTKSELKALLAEMKADEKKDPKGKKLEAEMAAAQAAHDARKEREREERNAKARERRASLKLAAKPEVKAVAKPAKKLPKLKAAA